MRTANIPLGTEFDDGIRVGPGFSEPAFVNQNGRGMLMGSLYTYNGYARICYGYTDDQHPITNFLFATAPLAANVPALTPVPIPLNQGNNTEAGYAPTYTKSPLTSRTTLGIQFDFPGCLLAIGASNAAGNAGIANNAVLTVNVFGRDIYDQPMIEQITLTQAGGGGVLASMGQKAFGSVSHAFGTCNAQMARGLILSITGLQQVGLPFWLAQAPNLNADPIIPGDLIPLGNLINGVTAGLPVDIAPTINGRDVRGSIGPTGRIGAGACFNIRFMQYVSGFDVGINQRAASDAFGGFVPSTEDDDVPVAVRQQKIMPVIPRALWSNPGFPIFDATFVQGKGVVLGPSGLYPVLPNVVTQYGAEQYWSEALAQQAKIILNVA